MALYIPHSIFHLARLLYVGPETFGPYYVAFSFNVVKEQRKRRSRGAEWCEFELKVKSVLS